MQGTTRHRSYQLAWFPLHGLVVLSVVGPALVGQMPVEPGGWVIGRRCVHVAQRGRCGDEQAIGCGRGPGD